MNEATQNKNQHEEYDDGSVEDDESKRSETQTQGNKSPKTRNKV